MCISRASEVGGGAMRECRGCHGACLHNADTICSANPHGAFRVHSLASKTPQEKIRKNPNTRGDKNNGHKGQGKFGMVAGRFLLGMTAAKNSRIVDEEKERSMSLCQL